jgi:hypothetical protein
MIVDVGARVRTPPRITGGVIGRVVETKVAEFGITLARVEPEDSTETLDHEGWFRQVQLKEIKK